MDEETWHRIRDDEDRERKDRRSHAKCDFASIARNKIGFVIAVSAA
jgi:hypothetical protein